MNIAVLFDGGGLARLGLDQAGHTCTGVELDESKHYLSLMVGSGNCVLGDARDFDVSNFDAIWASPPCQKHSQQRDNNAKKQTDYNDADLLDWSIALLDKYPDKVIWIENVISRTHDNSWGKLYNAAQFSEYPVQKRRRVIGGRYLEPKVYRPFKYNYPELDICPAVLASEYKQGGMARTPDKERRKATRWYGRPLSLREIAYHQNFEIPDDLLRSWFHIPSLINKETGKRYTSAQWRVNICQALGNGVPCSMSRAFGEAYNVP